MRNKLQICSDKQYKKCHLTLNQNYIGQLSYTESRSHYPVGVRYKEKNWTVIQIENQYVPNDVEPMAKIGAYSFWFVPKHTEVSFLEELFDVKRTRLS